MYIFLDAQMYHNQDLQGLCGNFNGNTNDDTSRTAGAIATNDQDYGNLWKVDPSCSDIQIDQFDYITDPCEVCCNSSLVRIVLAGYSSCCSWISAVFYTTIYLETLCLGLNPGKGI